MSAFFATHLLDDAKKRPFEMSDRQQLYEQIERYVAGTMDTQERAEFELLLRNDGALATEVNLHRSLQKALGDPDRRRLLDIFQDLPDVSDLPQTTTAKISFSRIWPAAAAIFILALSIWWWWPGKSTQISEPPTVAKVTTPPDVDSGVSNLPLPGDTPLPSVAPPAKKQLAMRNTADFSPNPALDPLIGTQIRSAAASVSMWTPAQDTRYTPKNGRIVLDIRGGAKGTGPFSARIFDNKSSDFSEKSALQSFELPVYRDSFVCQKTLAIKPGRYYLLLYREGSDEPEHVSRFFVE